MAAYTNIHVWFPFGMFQGRRSSPARSKVEERKVKEAERIQEDDGKSRRAGEGGTEKGWTTAGGFLSHRGSLKMDGLFRG